MNLKLFLVLQINNLKYIKESTLMRFSIWKSLVRIQHSSTKKDKTEICIGIL